MTINEISNAGRVAGESILKSSSKEHGSMNIENNSMEAVAEIMAKSLESGKDTAGEVYSKKEKEKNEIDKAETKDTKGVPEEEKNLKDIAATLTEEDYEALIEAGVVPEDMTLSEFSLAISKAKKSREKLEEKQGEPDAQDIVDENVRSRIEKALKQKNLPVTDENIAAILNTLEMTEHITQMSDQTFAYVLDNKLEPTVENIYKAVHSSGTNFKKSYISDEAWAELEPAVKKVIEEAGEQINSNPEKAMQDSKWLIENNIPLTAENLIYKNELENMREAYTQENAIDALTESILNKTELSQTIMTDEVAKSAELPDELFETVSMQRRLEEARITMLRDANAVIDENGFEINFEELEANLESLKALEDSLCRRVLTEAGIEADTDKVNIFKETLDTVWEISGFSSFVLADTFEIRSELDLAGFAEAGRTSRGRNAEESYEALMTKPRRDMGDSIKKAFANIDEILGEMDIETTDANRRAVKMLGYNNIPITEENINEMKFYDKKVTDLVDKMKPSVVLELIRENINPLSEKIDKLSGKVSDIIKEKGISPEDRYADFLVDCEKHNSITETERSAYIGIQRLLYQLEKSDGAAIGALVNSGRELTLGNLLTEIRTEKHRGFDVTAGNEQIELAVDTQSVNKIDEQIMQGYNERSSEYYRAAAEELFRKLTPGKLEALVGSGDGTGFADLENMSLEALLEEVNRASDEEVSASRRQRTEQIRALATTAAEEISFLESFEIPCTINNLLAAGAIRKGKSTRMPEKAAELEDEDKEQLFDFENALSEPGEFCEKLEKLENDYIEKMVLSEDIDSEQLNTLRMMRSEIRLSGQLRKRNVFEMPLKLGKEVTRLTLTLESGRSEQGVARISVSPEGFGKIQAEIRLSGIDAGITILTDSKKSAETLESYSKELKADFEEKGFSITGLSYGIEKLQDAFIYKHGGLNKENGGEESKTETAELLRAVKVLLGNVNMVLSA